MTASGLFDSHAHLDSPRFDGERPEIIARAKSAGVSDIMSCGSDLATSRQNADLAKAHDGVWAAAGIHGHEASSALSDPSDPDSPLDEQAWDALAKLALLPQVRAIGEIGLDYHYDFSPRSVQRRVLACQLKLAQDLDLPVILHNRESDADMREIVDSPPATLSGVLHCFLADQVMADWAIERGLYIGIAGPVTFKNVRHLPDIIRRIPLDRILIETDCPYLAPHPLRGQRNEPAFVRHVLAKLATVLDLDEDDLAARTRDNACALFGIG